MAGNPIRRKAAGLRAGPSHEAFFSTNRWEKVWVSGCRFAIAEAMGGEVDIRSREGEGTEGILTLPVKGTGKE